MHGFLCEMLTQPPSQRVGDVLFKKEVAVGAGWGLHRHSSVERAARERRLSDGCGEGSGEGSSEGSSAGESDDSGEDLRGAGKTGGLQAHALPLPLPPGLEGEPPPIPIDGYSPDGDPKERAAFSAALDRSPSPAKRPFVTAMRSPERKERQGFMPAGAKPLAPPLGSLVAIEALRRSS